MKKNAVILMVTLLVSGCGGMKLNPFSDNAKTNTDYLTYTCNDNKQFRLKMVGQNQHVWLQMTDHEVYLTRKDETGQEYANDQFVLTLNEEQTTLSKSGDLQYTGCHTIL